MNIFPLTAIGVSTLNSAGDMLDVRYHFIANKDKEFLNTINVENLGYENLKSMAEGSVDSREYVNSISKKLTLNDKQQLVIHSMEEDNAISNICDAYLKLYLLSLRVSKPNTINLDGIFASLPNNVWTNFGPVDVQDIDIFRSTKGEVSVKSVDKFPCMTDYIIPSGVRIADSSRVRLGAYLSEGTTIMHEGFVNFNAGTLGTAMIEGRISAGVVVGDNSDLGGGCSTMGTLSGGNNIKISIGENCLIGANAGVGIPLGDNCTIEAGLYITAGTKIELYKENGDLDGVFKGSKLSNCSNLVFLRNSQNGKVIAKVNQKSINLNSELHKND